MASLNKSQRIPLVVFLAISFVASLIFSVIMSACGAGQNSGGGPSGAEPDSHVSFKTEPVSGMIAGQDWTIASGRARTDLFDPTKISIEIWDGDVQNPCASFVTSERKVLFSIPARLGSIALSSTQTFTIYHYGNGVNSNLGVTTGSIALIEITDTFVGGMIVGTFDSMNQVNGSFRVVRCLGN